MLLSEIQILRDEFQDDSILVGYVLLLLCDWRMMNVHLGLPVVSRLSLPIVRGCPGLIDRLVDRTA